MALTINRKDEINEQEFEFIKNKFAQNTNSQAIYASIKYVVYTASEMEVEINTLKEKLKEAKKKHNKLLKTIQKKHDIDTIYKEIVSSEFKKN